VKINIIKTSVLMGGLLFSGIFAWSQERTELGVADSFTVNGTRGTKDDPDVKLSGFTVFGTNTLGAVAVTSGVGNVYIQNTLEVGSNIHVHGVGIVFPDSTTQTTAFASSSLGSSLVSGECDTNRTDILMSTNYVITSVKVQQSPVIPQGVQVYSNGVPVGLFGVGSGTAEQGLSLSMNAFDRLGIACTNVNGTVLFVFEGYRP
jgi:hypothetical protein